MSRTRSHIPDHEAEALEEGISRLWTSPTLRALLAALSGPIQALESLMLGTSLAGSLDSATGRDLDLLGGLIGEFRRGLPDSEYRRILRGAVWAARSSTTRDEIIDLFRLLLGDEGSVEYYDRYPANIELVYLRADELTDRFKNRVARLIEDALPLGVGARFASVDLGGGFVFGGLDGDEGDEVGAQFGGLDAEAGDPEGSTFGGLW